MKTVRPIAFFAACLLSATAWAQSSSAPLNLKIPANVPAAPASTATPANTDTTQAAAPNTTTATQAAQASTGGGNSAYAKDPPGTYYGDTSGRLGDSQAALSQPAAVVCDDATYNQPQVHGAVGMGVVSGRHTSGSYTGGAVTMSQAFGSCEHPTGGVSISVQGTQGHFGR
ncbi:MAG TPA: hypothetical protein VFG49_16430 [Dyella sp.]|uniref:hypothetical protein n=1 Tax=Dyella sp. TaxID=1869338 RepID=UPI002D78604E|nr:hypothetical protein [Dyella sp.]HET6555113.1 hypothetical protein [Dyella sp.]